MADPLFASEADLVAAFCAEVERRNQLPADRRHAPVWTIYHETAGWDLLLVDDMGVQVGIEAKLSLNAKVLVQALPHHHDNDGPDYRAVLVPDKGLQQHLTLIAEHLGLTVIRCSSYESGWPEPSLHHQFGPSLPVEHGTGERLNRLNQSHWHSWLPPKRCKLPDYVPDVRGGKAAPIMLTDWKVRAIKLMILLERRGVVTRKDMKHLGLDATRWTANGHGFLAPGPGGYVQCERSPDLRAQHPENYPAIEADFDSWAPSASVVQPPLDLAPAVVEDARPALDTAWSGA